MQSPGEEIVGEYLKHIRSCEFIAYNVYTPDVQGEIDVVGLNTEKKILYICEIATHLTTGLLYVTNGQTDNVGRFVKKFTKNINYANTYFDGYEKHFMLWSPIVIDTKPGSKHNQLQDVIEIQESIYDSFDVLIEPVINQRYSRCLRELRDFAAKETKALQSPILRLMQVEEKLAKHLDRLP